jgi:uncharacterized protein (TIGR02646 family)
MGERLMKRVCKGPPPQTLNGYLSTNPSVTWDDMSSDNYLGGSQASRDCRDQAVHDQGNICAYCEQKISSADPLHRRIEHFHPKSDRTESHNWGLDWENMLAVCDGGSRRLQEGWKSYPLPENLSCDAYKDHMRQTGKLPVACEGYLLNPCEIPPFPNIFCLEGGSWRLKPNETSCGDVKIQGNAYETTAKLVGNTIDFLNLNCDRLTRKRELLVYNINRNKKTLRDKGYSPPDIPEKLVQRYFSSKWPEFFTTLRCLLGATVENYLKSINFQG